MIKVYCFGMNEEFQDIVKREIQKFIEILAEEFALQPKSAVRVEIYSPFERYKAKVCEKLHTSTLPNWVVGCLIDGVIYLTDPEDPGPYHNYASVLRALRHELVHWCVEGNKNETSWQIPWFDEGLANYAAEIREQHLHVNKQVHRFGESQSGQIVQKRVREGRIPSLTELEQNFVKREGYHVAPTIFLYLSSIGKLHQTIKSYLTSENVEQFYEALEISHDDLELQWRQFLRENYGNGEYQSF